MNELQQPNVLSRLSSFVTIPSPSADPESARADVNGAVDRGVVHE